jgi:hypothetical protein
MAYNRDGLPPHLSALFSSINTTAVSSSDLDLFFHCWIQPHCPACLSSTNPYPCSWCATSQTCVPNIIFEYPFGILAPIKSPDVCPLRWREKWEMRARPFGCRCSSMTFMSTVVAVVVTLLSLLMIWLGIKLGSWMRRKWKARREGWWKPSSRGLPCLQRSKRGKDASTETEAERETHAHEAGTTSEHTPLLV